LEILSWPELSQAGSIGGVYSQKDVLDVLAYAKYRGVRVIPELDTPAHTEAWGRSEKLSNIVIKCNDEYEGQFDPTNDTTY
jgi:hexosaminidase